MWGITLSYLLGSDTLSEQDSVDLPGKPNFLINSFSVFYLQRRELSLVMSISKHPYTGCVDRFHYVKF